MECTDQPNVPRAPARLSGPNDRGEGTGVNSPSPAVGYRNRSATPADLPEANSPGMEIAREAIMDCVRAAGGVSLAEALEIQARMAAEFLASATCGKGVVGAEYTKTMKV